jgi:hypothetical protein
VTRPAGGRVVERPESFFGCEALLEEELAAIEGGELIGGQPRERVAELRAGEVALGRAGDGAGTRPEE